MLAGLSQFNGYCESGTHCMRLKAPAKQHLELALRRQDVLYILYSEDFDTGWIVHGGSPCHACLDLFNLHV